MIDLSLFLEHTLYQQTRFLTKCRLKIADLEILSYKYYRFLLDLHKKCNGMLFEKYIQTIIKNKKE